MFHHHQHLRVPGTQQTLSKYSLKKTTKVIGHWLQALGPRGDRSHLISTKNTFMAVVVLVRSHYETQAGLQLMILLPQPPEY